MANRRRSNAPSKAWSPEAHHRIVSGEEARQGRIVLTTQARRAAFIGGLAVLVLLPLVIALLVR